MNKQYRIKIIDKFNSLIKNKKKSMLIEQSIYDYIKEQADEHKIEDLFQNKFYKKQYMIKCVSIYNNLNSKSYIGNKKLIKNVKKKNYDIKNIAKLSPIEMFPEHWKTLLDQKNASEEFLYDKNLSSVTHEYTCGACKNNNCSKDVVQIRSADEPMTILVQCIDCGFSWKM